MIKIYHLLVKFYLRFLATNLSVEPVPTLSPELLSSARNLLHNAGIWSGERENSLYLIKSGHFLGFQNLIES